MKTLFYEDANQLDELIELSSPKEKDANLLVTLIKTESLEQYFFKHLAQSANSAWFPLLRKHGYFDEMPKPIKVEGGIQYPRWIALDYLVTIASDSEISSDWVEVVENIQFENAYWLWPLVGAFNKLSIKFIDRIPPIIQSWLDKNLPVTEELISLIDSWAKENQWGYVVQFIDMIIQPQEAYATVEQRQNEYFSPRARFREFDHIIEDFLKGISKFTKDPYLDVPWEKIIIILEDSLTQAIKIEEKQGQFEKSSFWRSSIEPSSQNVFGDRCKDLLLNTIRDIAENLPLESKTQVVENYLVHSFSVFRRLAIHLIREDKNLWDHYLENLYKDPKFWDEIDYYHEYWLLTKDSFTALDKTQQEIYFERLLSELSEKGDKEENTRAHHWVFRRLWAIKENLPSNVEKIFKELRSEFNDPDPEELFAFLAYSSGVTWGSESSRTSQELLHMSPDEILSELEKEFPSDRKSFGEPTVEGLATELRNAIKENPSRFAEIAPKFFGEKILKPHTSSVLRGFEEAWKAELDFSWEPVLHLCQDVANTIESLTDDGTPADMETNYWANTYGEARQATVKLLDEAVRNDDHAIPHEYLGQVRDILLRLCDDPNPSTEYEAEWGSKDNWDFLTLSLNVTRASAVAALINYALHRSRIVEKGESLKDLLPEGVRIEPQVRDKLSERLDIELEKSKAVHVNFGLYLANLNYLDKEWLQANLEKIFPLDPEKVEYWKAAWKGYTWHGTLYLSLYPVLKPYYVYAVEQLKYLDGDELQNSEKRLAEHLAFLYANGDETYIGENSLVDKFFDISSDNLHSVFVETLNPVRIPPALQDAESQEWKRIKKFWHRRYEFIQHQDGAQQFKKELASYLLWVPNLPEPIVNFSEQIQTSVAIADDWPLNKLFEHFAKERVAEKYPAFAMNLFESVLQRKDLRLYFLTGREETRTILDSARNSQDQEARESAIRVINMFGERGDESYRDLL